jgi:hypothetical protein
MAPFIRILIREFVVSHSWTVTHSGLIKLIGGELVGSREAIHD